MEIKTQEVNLEDGIRFTSETYIANDGKEFHYKSDCINYENAKTAKENIAHVQYKKAIYDVECEDLEFGTYENWYYITCKEDMRAVIDYVNKVVTKFKKYSGYKIIVTDSEYQIKESVGQWVSYRIYWEEANEFPSYECEFITYMELEKEMMKKIEQFNNLKNTLSISNQTLNP